MLSRFSVKHPYLIVVTVIICLILGGVSLAKMKTDLMPDMDVPYLAVIATDEELVIATDTYNLVK
jgi:multidrug efflux pump subunit AcrB